MLPVDIAFTESTGWFDFNYYTPINLLHFEGGGEIITPVNTEFGSIKILRFWGPWENGFNYKIHIVDISNNNVIVEKTLSNTEKTTNDLSGFTNIPTNETSFELQCKVEDSKNRANVYSFIMDYN